MRTSRCVLPTNIDGYLITDVTPSSQESYEIGSEENREDYNIWLPEHVLPGFRGLMSQVYWRLNDIASIILEALIKGAGFSEDEATYVRGLHTSHHNQLRLLHYPSMPQGTSDLNDQPRLGAHSDWRYVALTSVIHDV